MAKALTDIAIQKLKAGPTRREIPDRTPLLYLIMQPTGRRRFALRYRFDGRTRKVTLPTGLSLAAARKMAADAALELDRGGDPREARKAAKAKAAAAAADTLWAICGKYLAREGGKLRTLRQRERVLARHIYPAFGDRPIGSIRRGEIVRLLDRIEDKSGSRTADVVLSILRTVFNWWAVRDESFVPPTVRGMARHSTAAHARTRILYDDELRRVWQTAESSGVFGALLKFLLLTGARKGEVTAMTWDEVVNGIWTLPASRNKTGQELARPLSAAALAIIEAQPHVAGMSYVFTMGEHPLRGVWRMKSRLDAATSVTGWTIHDLRRTSRSLLSRCGVNADVAERCLGHVIGGIRGTYDRYRYQAEMLAAYEALSAQIERILYPQDTVIALRKGAATDA
jgi:integrase